MDILNVSTIALLHTQSLEYEIWVKFMFNIIGYRTHTNWTNVWKSNNDKTNNTTQINQNKKRKIYVDFHFTCDINSCGGMIIYIYSIYFIANCGSNNWYLYLFRIDFSIKCIFELELICVLYRGPDNSWQRTIEHTHLYVSRANSLLL